VGSQTEIDARVQAYYGREFAEGERLTTLSAQGRLEFERTQDMIAARVRPSSRILDVGGATGAHAAPLAAQGHKVTLLDPVAAQVDAARAHGTFEAFVGDARSLDFPNDSFDAVLLFGPLYHLVDQDDRHRCLREAARVTVPGGWVFAAAIPRFARHAQFSLGRQVTGEDREELAALLETGAPVSGGRFPGAHFHTADELEREMRAAGLVDAVAYGLEGPAGLALQHVGVASEEVHQAAKTLAREFEAVPATREMSNHLIGIGRVPTSTE
jgi:SAM-dependent methyltransferase